MKKNLLMTYFLNYFGGYIGLDKIYTENYMFAILEICLFLVSLLSLQLPHMNIKYYISYFCFMLLMLIKWICTGFLIYSMLISQHTFFMYQNEWQTPTYLEKTLLIIWLVVSNIYSYYYILHKPLIFPSH